MHFYADLFCPTTKLFFLFLIGLESNLLHLTFIKKSFETEFKIIFGKVSEKSTKGLKNVLFLHEIVSLTLLVIFLMRSTKMASLVYLFYNNCESQFGGKDFHYMRSIRTPWSQILMYLLKLPSPIRYQSKIGVRPLLPSDLLENIMLGYTDEIYWRLSTLPIFKAELKLG